MDIDHLGNQVRMERLRRGLTQRQLGEIAGVSKGRIEAFEKGRCLDMHLSTVRSVLAALGFRILIAPEPPAQSARKT